MSDLAGIADDRVAALAHEILARNEYARFRDVDAREVAAWLERFFGRLHELSTVSPGLYFTILIALLLVAMLLLAHVTISLRAALRASEPPKPREAKSAQPDLDREAAQLAAAGRLLEAAHVMQLACLRGLLDHGAFELRRHDPNPVLRERVARSDLPDRERGEFLALLDRLETRWFRDRAQRENDHALFDAWRSLHERLVALGRA
jgi:hypothetical protein